MTEFIVPFYYLLAGICFYASIMHLIYSWPRPFDRVQLFFSGASFGVFWLVLFYTQGLHASSVEEFILELKLSLTGSMFAIVFIFLLVANITRLIPRNIVLSVLALNGLFLVMNWLAPDSLQYSQISHLTTRSFPWGEHLVVAAGETSPWFSLAGIIVFFEFGYQFVIYLIYAGETGKRTDYYMLAALGAVFILSMQGILVRLGIIPFIPLGPLGFVILIITWSISIRAEAAQRLRLANIAFANITDGIMITDAHHKIIATNPAFTTLTGYEANEALALTADRLQDHESNQGVYQAAESTLRAHGNWQGEVVGRRKNGERFPQWLHISAVKDHLGTITHYVGAFSDLSSSKKAQETIHQLAFYDPLTKLPNRRLMLDRLQQALLSSQQNRQFCAVLFINLDDFKSVNDTYGHKVGDQLLVETAKRIQNCLHANDTLAREGGDVFMVILNALDNSVEQAAIQVETIAERIHKAIKTPIQLAGETYFAKACIGISVFHDKHTSAEELLKRADAAMFQAKASGRNKVHFFNTDMQDALEARLLLENWLNKAVPEQLRVFYQIQVDTQGNPIGAEALLRWQHPEQGMISPLAFIPLAEQTGLIIPIGRWVLETACQQLKAWERHPQTAKLVLSVNVSAKEFQQPNFIDQVQEIVHRTGIRPGKLKLELTESMLADDIDTLISKMTTLKSLGVLFSLDDFGTGFSSLSYLKNLPLDDLKIDQSFVRDLTQDAHDEVIVHSIIALGRSLAMDVIAEGVETQEQLKYLTAHGCEYFQGYLFGKPQPIEEFDRAVLSHQTNA